MVDEASNCSQVPRYPGTQVRISSPYSHGFRVVSFTDVIVSSELGCANQNATSQRIYRRTCVGFFIGQFCRGEYDA